MLFDKNNEKYLCPSGRMLELMKYALSYQFYITQQEDSSSKPKYCSLLKDIVTQKQAKVFSSKHLKEFTLSFSKKYNSSIFNEDPISEDSLEKEKQTSKVSRFNNPAYWNNDDEEYVAQTIDLDERKDNTERGFFSTYKFRDKSKNQFQKSDTVRGVLYKHDGKIDVEASIDFLNKGKEELEKSPISKGFANRRDSGITSQSMMRLQSYRSIQHEPSNQEQSDAVSRSNYSALKSQIDRFTSPKLDEGNATTGPVMKRNNSEEEQSKDASGRYSRFGERSQFHPKSVADYDETIYNLITMKEKGYVNDVLPIRAGCFSPDGMYFAIGTNSRCIKICSLNDILESLKPEEETGDLTSMHINQEIPIVFDQLNYHDGSIYCMDWSENERLIATGSNDKQIKLLVNPLLLESDPQNILELTLKGHRAKIRTL